MTTSSTATGLSGRISERARRMGEGFGFQTSIPTAGYITLGGGTPDFPTPPHVVAAGKRALDEGKTTYTRWLGIPELCQAVADKLARENGLHYDAETEIMITAGSQEALIVLLQALIDPGDEVLIPSPHYTEYDRDVALCGGRLVHVQTRLEDNYDLDPARLEAAITPRTKLIVLISPSNPTGTMLSREAIEGVAAVAQRHDLLVLSDELYEHFIYDGNQHHSIGALPGMRERTITINGFSKRYSMTGWRIGYYAAPAEIIRATLPIHHGTMICAPAMSQWAALAGITGTHEWFDDVLAEYARRRAIWRRGLDAMGLGYAVPQGAYYVFFDTAATGLTPAEFSRRMREAKVIVGAGGGSGPFTPTYVRGSLVVPAADLEEGLARMQAVVERARS